MSTSSPATGPGRQKKKWTMDINIDLLRPIHGSCSRYGRKRKLLTSLADFCVLGRNGQYTDLVHNDVPATTVTVKKGPPAATMAVVPSNTELNHPPVQEPSYDELSNEENMPVEDKIFIDTDLFRADAPPNLKTYKRKYQPLSPVAVLNTLPKQASKAEVDVKQEAGVKIKQQVPVGELIVKKSNIKATLASKNSQATNQTIKKECPGDSPQKLGGIKLNVTIKQESQVGEKKLQHGVEPDKNITQENPSEVQLRESSDQVKQAEDAAQEKASSPSAQDPNADQLNMRCAVQLKEWSPGRSDIKKSPKEHRERPQFRVGDMVWARMSCNAAYWPALVTREQLNLEFYRNTPSSSPNSKALYHVSFYGSKTVNCAAWVSKRSVLPYQGSANLDFSDTEYRQNIGAKAARIPVCKQKSAMEIADHALQLSGMQRVHGLVAWLEELKEQSTEKKRVNKARKAELAAKSDEENEYKNAKSPVTVMTESAKKDNSAHHFLVVKTGPFKRLRLSSPSPPRQKAEIKEEVHKVATKRGPLQNKLIQNIMYNKRRLAGVPTSKVCEKCLEPGKAGKAVVSCAKCRRAVHKTCAQSQNDGYVCGQCRGGLSCGICNEAHQKETKLLKCTNKGCSRQFHAHCLKGWHQAKHNYNDSLICPYHTCHMCVSDDPGSQRLFVTAEHLLRCIYCPTAYHTADACIPAATRVLSTTQCGVLAVCDTCPTTYHPACLERTSAASASNHCAECESGCFPVSGQVVWAKHGNYRWWPARIAFQDEVPNMYECNNHNYNEYVVQFLGSYDIAWSSNKRVFPYIPEVSLPTSTQLSAEPPLTIIGPQDTKSEQCKKLTHGKFETKFQLGLTEAETLCSTSREARLEARNSLYQQPPKYQSIKVNRIISTGIRTRMQEMVRLQTEGSDRCSCSPKDPNPCGFGTGCLNRDLCVECDVDCPSGSLCQNRLFSKCLYSPVKPILTAHCGWGLAANADIKEGDFVIEYVGDVIDETELQVRIEKLQTNHDKNFYFLAVEGQLYIDAGPRGNEARFMNHCCEPNCKVEKWIAKSEMRMGLFATKDIPKNTELTFNYNLQLFGDKTQQCFYQEQTSWSSAQGEEVQEVIQVLMLLPH
ncbi:hypothetical protein B566_EDAN010512 [Ephemera danica]|nr:hypothetical protein B566_EDAN010512 [Ephemera danica]